MTPSRLSSRWMYAQSGWLRSCTGAARGNNRASRAASSNSAGSGQPNPRCAVRCRYSETVPTPIAQAWAIARWDNPRSCLRRRTSRIFLTSSLRAGIASPSFRKASVRRSGYRRAFTMTGFRVQLHRIPCSTSRIRCSTSAGSGVQLPPDYATGGGRCDHWGVVPSRTAVMSRCQDLVTPGVPGRGTARERQGDGRRRGQGSGTRAMRRPSPTPPTQSSSPTWMAAVPSRRWSLLG